MTDDELIEKWLSIFGDRVDKGLIEEYVTSYGNHLWHLFSWKLVPCLEGDEARTEFNKLEYLKAIKFYDGHSKHIEDISTVSKVSVDELDHDPGNDVYIVAQDFSWTYVRTHEDCCGPYLCIKK